MPLSRRKRRTVEGMKRRARAHRESIAWVALLLFAAIATRPARVTASEGRARAMTFDELRELAIAVGFTPEQARIAAAIAIAESGGDPWAQGDPRGVFQPTPNGSSTSFGLWQVHAPDHPEFNPGDLLTTDYNARAAYMISKGGTDFSPWTTYRDGSYRRYLPEGNA
jgi:hypothetical protein